MSIRRSIQLSFLLMALGSNHAHAFDLLEAWQAARTQDPAFAAARAAANAGRTKSLQADALTSPQLTLNAGAAGVSNDNKITDARFSNAQFAGGASSNKGTTDFRTKTDGGLDLNLNLRAEYPLYDALRAGSVKQLNKQAALAEVQLAAESQQLMLRVAQAYFDVLRAKDTLATLKAQQLAVAEALASAKARFAEGDLAIIDTHETQARFDLLASQVMEAESNLQLMREALGDATGNRDAALAALSNNTDFQRYVSGDMQSWISRAQSNHPQVYIQQLQQEIAQAETGKFKDRYAPVLNLVAQAGGERLQGLGNGDADLTNRQISLGVQLTVPLYTGGMRDARYQEAIALEQQALSQTDVARQNAVRDARSAWMAVTVGQGQVKALEQALRSAEIKLDSTKLGRDVGDRTTLDVLNSEQELHNTRLALSRSRYQVLQALLNLSAAAGELDEVRLQEINEVLAK
ncbi:MAG TPA: TolC family outer membrane protein [Methylotenera sp.]|nr:TolC family outer membrane protein [Methylotenera sp.]